ncbi:MAG: 2-oxoglutarate dehydrogenase complex dihydrolipoyllysine-residue succinyltransferase [Candidatus Latescibacterota bacterium]|nr:2-oxoglutarate dehydrogenase complex dihydrolipoyllysine-residue succinyltransferase [Candidatus Latescibacterota bacterium]
MAMDVEIPAMGESVSEVILIEWLKEDGEYVERDEAVCVLETDKANVDLPAPAAGVLKHGAELDSTLGIGAVIARIEEGDKPAAEEAEAPQSAPEESASEPATEQAAEKALSPAARRLAEEQGVDVASVEGTGKNGLITKEDVRAAIDVQETPVQETPKAQPLPSTPQPVAPSAAPPAVSDGDGQRREPMSRLRQRIAQHLVSAQHSAAMLTTFNEIDLSAVMELRARYKERFNEVHGISLGFMSFFSRAAVLALREFPAVNAQIDGTDVVYNDYVHLGIAVSTERGLVVPVLRRAEQMSMAEIESEIKRLALGARDNKLAMDELNGGTFTITNGGVFGSLLSTPIINAPQSGILGMHAIQQRPVAVDGQVVIRPMMYVALSYDHRIIDGQQSVKFLVRLKELVEDPARLMLEV